MSDESSTASSSADTQRARRWAAAFTARSPDLLEAYLGGSRAAGTAVEGSDYDVVLVTRGDGPLSVSNFQTPPTTTRGRG